VEQLSLAAQDSLEVDVPLHFVGEAPGVKIEGGSLDTVFTELKVQCAPDSIPETIEVDVSHLNMGDMLHVHELNLPPGVTALQEAEQIVVSVLPPQLVTEPAEEVETGTESSSDAAS
jgi:large subunit ribosomal protein L25